MSMKKLFFIFFSFFLFLPLSSLAKQVKGHDYQPVINLSGGYNEDSIYVLNLKDPSLDSSNIENFDVYKFSGLSKLENFILITVDTEKMEPVREDLNVYESRSICLFVSGDTQELEQTKDTDYYTFALQTVPTSHVRRPGPYSLPFSPELASILKRPTSENLPFPIFEHLVGDSNFQMPFHNTPALNVSYKDLNPFFSLCP